MSTLRWFRLVWLVGGLAFVLAELREPFLRTPVLPGADRDGWVSGDFKPDATYHTTVRGTLPKNIATAGSWIGGDEWQGTAATPWMPAPPGSVRVAVAGYPHVTGCSLRVEFRHTNGTVSSLECPVPNPGEQWMPWDFHVPAYPVPTTALRLVSEDRSGATCGWVAFSQPYLPRSALVSSSYQGAQVLATLALVLALVWLPGLLAAPAARTPEMRTALILGVGPAILVILGLLLWCLGGWVRPAYLGPALVWTFWGAIGLGLWRRRLAPEPGPAPPPLLALVALCTLAATAKVTYSGGPEGELYHATICRTLAVGNRGDVRVSFYPAQAIQRRLAPASAAIEQYYTPWTFFSRGPLAGLAAAPVVFATGGRPPVAPSDTVRWEPFDPTGYAACRIALIALGGMVIFAFFAVLALFVSTAWALLGAGLLALCPFVVHEMFFVWPKLVATAWLLAAFLFAHQRRGFPGGLALGIGYLFHPMALLWAPWLALWAARDSGGGRAWVASGARFALGGALLVVPWMAASLLPHHLPTTDLAGQAGFVRYFVLADWQPATLATWLHTRWMNFSNTFLPFWLHFVYESHSDINSAYTPAGPLVKFAFSWWNTLPLGMGLALWAGCMAALIGAVRLLRAAVILWVVAPSLLLTVYWGTAPTGLMRECGHPLLVAVIGIAVIWLARTPGPLARLAVHPAVPWLQLPETFLLLWLTTLANPNPPSVELKSLDPVWFALNLAALLGAARLASRLRFTLQSSPAPAAS